MNCSRMDGWTDGRMDGRTDGRMDGWTDGRMDGWTDGRIDDGQRTPRHLISSPQPRPDELKQEHQ